MQPSIGIAILRDDDTLELTIRRRGRGPGGEELAPWEITRRRDGGQGRLFEATIAHLGGLQVGVEKPVPPWPGPAVTRLADGTLVLEELPEMLLAIRTDRRGYADALRLVGEHPIGERHALDRPTASALSRGIISAAANPSFDVTDFDREYRPDEVALLSVVMAEDRSLEVYLGMPGEVWRAEHVRKFSPAHPRYAAVLARVRAELGDAFGPGHNRLVRAWPEDVN